MPARGASARKKKKNRRAHMLRTVDVNLSLTARAREKIRSRLSEATYPAIPGLLFGRDEATNEEAWRVGFYDRRDLEKSDFGGVLLMLGDIEIFFPQLSFLARLSNMELDWDGSRYSLRPAKMS